MIPTKAASFLLVDEQLQAMKKAAKPFSETAWHIWKTKYADFSEETPSDTVDRIVHALSDSDTAEAISVYKALQALMSHRVVAFNSPVYFNLGVKENPQCSACFILGVEDTMESIAELGSTEMSIFRQGSGSGVNYSNLRGNGESLSNGGKASGPVSFMKALDTMAGVVKSGGRCLPAYQKVYTDKGPVEVKKLADLGKRFVVLSFDPPAGRVKAKFAQAWLSGKKRIVEVITDKGKFRLSEDHPVKLSSGEYRKAGQLKPGNSIKKTRIDVGKGDYLRINQLDVNRKWEDKRTGLHTLFARDLLGAGLNDAVHHWDENILNNELDNLAVLSRTVHTKLHMSKLTEQGEHVFQRRNFSHAGELNGMHGKSAFWHDIEKVKAYKKKQGKILKESGRAREMQKRASKQRMLNFAYRLLNLGGKVDTFEAYIESRNSLINTLSERQQGLVKVCINRNFGSYANFVQEINRGNHRVQDVIFLEEEPVYSVEVFCPTKDDKSLNSGHNFMIWPLDNDGSTGSGIFVSNTRRAARIALLDSDHPDIWEFINCKRDEEKKLKALASIGALPSDHFDNPAAYFQNTNHTVRLFDHDMEENKQLISEIAEAIWECGDPGLHFADTVRRAAPPEICEQIHASNPCSEVVFLDDSACNLACINIAHGYFSSPDMWQRLANVTSIMTYVMDRIVDISSYPTERIRQNSIKYRPLGLGITGFAEYLLNNKVTYGNELSCNAARNIMQKIQTAAKETCPDNYQHTLIAPTGTTSLFLDAESTGIEPIYAAQTFKRMADDKPIVLEPECIKRAYEEGRDHQIRCTTGDNCVTPQEHIDVVAAAQLGCCGSISKTVNLPNSVTVGEIEGLIYYAWKKKVKTITFYRDGSKAIQPLTIEKKPVKEEAEEETAGWYDECGKQIVEEPRLRLDQERDAITRKFNVGGEEGYITVGLYSDGSPGEIFIRVSKVGSTMQGFIDQLGIAWSMALQHGVPLKALVDKAKGSRFEPSGFTGDDLRSATSIADYLAKWLEKRFLTEYEEEDDLEEYVEVRGLGEQVSEVERTRQLIRESYDSPTCKSCGGLTQPSGTCYVCMECGETTGCS